MRNKKAFTLIETLVALFIGSIILITLLYLIRSVFIYSRLAITENRQLVRELTFISEYETATIHNKRRNLQLETKQEHKYLLKFKSTLGYTGWILKEPK